MKTRWAFALLIVVTPAAATATATEDAQKAQLEALRAEIASQVQLSAYDLIDDLVYAWSQSPVFDQPTPVVLADVSVPVGLGTGLRALIENHFAGLVVHNPSSNVLLSHCPQCMAIVVHSGAKGTVVSRGVDAPEALDAAGGLAASRHALFLDFEAEGASLVLRARITEIDPSLPIVYARTLSSATSTAALLRSGEPLKSAAEARKEYLDALEGRSVLTVPLRLVVRSYAPELGSTVAGAPFVWLQSGLELALTPGAAWTAGFGLGYTWAPDLYSGWLAHARIARLLSGSVRSLTQPDLYLFGGVSAITILGPAAVVFRNSMPNIDDVVLQQQGKDPRSTFAAWQLGLELRVKNRIGASLFLEALPALTDSPSLGSYVDLGFIVFQSMGAEVSFCF